MKPTPPDFTWVKMPARQYKARIDLALNALRSTMKEIKSIPDSERTFENTVAPLEFATQKLYGVWGSIDFLMNSKPNKSDRELAKTASDYAQNQALELSYDEDIYKAFSMLRAKDLKLKGADKVLFEDYMLGYRLIGFDLSKSKRNVVKAKMIKHAKLCSDFSKNINEYQDHILVAREELAGASDSYIAGLPKVADKYKVGLDNPSYLPFMENVTNEAKRKELSDKFLRKGGPKNIEVLKKMVKIRQEMAHALGFKNHAELRMVNRMAKNPETVFKFLNSLIKPLRKKAVSDIAQMLKTKAQLAGKVQTGGIETHDVIYLMNQDKKLQHNVDDREVREYFPLDVVTKGMFGIYEKLLGVKFIKEKNIPTWHKDVQTFSVKDVATKKTMGYFFLDLYPREGKYGHAAVFPIIPGLALPGGGYQNSIVAMMCNFSKPTKINPSLLSHDEVETYFHEFGHLVHGTLTQAKYGSQSGTSVQHDFAEAPSQMLEGWVWDEKILNILSGHYKNSKNKLPKVLLKKMLGAKNHMIGYFNMRQLALATFDTTLHTKLNVKDPSALYAKVVKDLLGVKMPKDQLWPAGFGHLNGYDAGYYGYMWSKVYASDMFTRFAKEGLLNAKIGRDYRKYILEPGGSKKSMDLVIDFLGRKPNTKAFLKELGL